ncbi:response regulator transcription factor [Bullifex sp.]|uniref:DNA-binding response regulator n=1 Tax=Bullifex sp. TaxID=2815808 RepID=UPI002A7F2D51|nr:response regulator transcription factor [Bullifex sp.]MDD5973817.1 response regulator transcription factor [Spirochaetales bacterium]MDY4067677.1 response regulator transcription factor [Bullifex sp.]
MIKLMIADDFDILREDLKENLESLGYCVSKCVSSALDAVNEYDESIDIVLMDIEMEESDSGIKAAEAILDKYKDAKIIYLTSHDSDEMIMTAFATGAEDFIVKGVSAQEIKEHIDAVYNNKPQLDDRVRNIVMCEYKRLRQSEQNLLYFIKHISSLTPTEKDLIHCFLLDMKVREIASQRNVELSTVKSQIRTLLQKFGCSRSKEIVVIIKGLGLEHLFN